MRIVELIIKMAFFLGVTLVPIFILGPMLIQKAFVNEDEGLQSISRADMTINYLQPGNKNYITLEVQIQGGVYKHIYRLSDNKHEELVDFLSQNNFISNPRLDNLPIKVSGDKLTTHAVQIRPGANNNIEKLVIDEYEVVGQSTSGARRTMLAIVGVLIILFCLVLFVIGCLFYYNYFREFKATGHLPKLPNTIDDMKRGLKFWIGK